jgi:hypothetical protein
VLRPTGAAAAEHVEEAEEENNGHKADRDRHEKVDDGVHEASKEKRDFGPHPWSRARLDRCVRIFDGEASPFRSKMPEAQRGVRLLLRQDAETILSRLGKDQFRRNRRSK